MDTDPDRRRKENHGLRLAPGLTVIAFAASGMGAGTQPFGPRSRSSNDLAMQYVPMHAHLWDLLHGVGPGDIVFNWQSGFGVPFLADFAYYLSSPFAVLIGLFPRDRIDLAVYVITVLKLAAAATAMAAYLIRLRPARTWIVGVLGASYGLCGWAIDDGAHVPMWLDGLIAFPLFCLVGEWSLRRRRRLLSIAVITVFWFANFYTAYMATLGAGVVLLVRLLTCDLSWMNRLRVLVRHSLSVSLGVALTAPLLVPVMKASGAAWSAHPGSFRPVTTDAFLSRLLPLADGVGAGPRIFVGTVALLLAVTLPLNRSVSASTRTVWTVTAVLLAGSFQWGPTQNAWHGFDAPNGNPYRQAFVLCGVLVIAGWLSVSHHPPRSPAVGGALVILAGLALLGRNDTRGVTLFAISAALAGLTVLAAKRLEMVVVVVLAGILLVEASMTGVEIHHDRARVFWTRPVWQGEHDTTRSAVVEANGWPVYRADPGTEFTANDPLLLGGESGSYYSSFLPATLHRSLDDLGFRWSAHGLSMPHLDSPVVDVLFSVGVQVRDGVPYRTAVPPLVTVRPARLTHRPETVYARHEALIGSRLYEVPVYRVVKIGPGQFRLEARCRSGSTAYLFAPSVVGAVRLDGGAEIVLRSSLRRPWVDGRGGLVELGQVPHSGAVSVMLRQTGGATGVPSAGALGCLDSAKLAAAVNRLRSSGAVEVRTGGHSIDARLPRPTSGIAVVAVPRVPGWQCARDGGPWHQPESFGGLLAVPLPEPTTRIGCRYWPPGLGPGLAICGIAAMITVGLAVASRRGAKSVLRP